MELGLWSGKSRRWAGSELTKQSPARKRNLRKRQFVLTAGACTPVAVSVWSVYGGQCKCECM